MRPRPRIDPEVEALAAVLCIAHTAEYGDEYKETEKGFARKPAVLKAPYRRMAKAALEHFRKD